MPTCTFSGEKIPTGRGLQYVQKDGKILWFKDSKAMKNFLGLKRNPRKVKWTKTYRDANQKTAKVAENKAPAKEEKKVEAPKKETKPEEKPAAQPAKEEAKEQPKAEAEAKPEATKEGETQ